MRRELKECKDANLAHSQGMKDASEWYHETDRKKNVAIRMLEGKTVTQKDLNKTTKVSQDIEVSKVQKIYVKDLQNLQHEIAEKEHRLQEQKSMRDRKENLEREIAEFEVEYKTDKREGMIRINQAEFEKIKDVKKLTEEMDFKVKET